MWIQTGKVSSFNLQYFVWSSYLPSSKSFMVWRLILNKILTNELLKGGDFIFLQNVVYVPLTKNIPIMYSLNVIMYPNFVDGFLQYWIVIAAFRIGSMFGISFALPGLLSVLLWFIWKSSIFSMRFGWLEITINSRARSFQYLSQSILFLRLLLFRVTTLS